MCQDASRDSALSKSRSHPTPAGENSTGRARGPVKRRAQRDGDPGGRLTSCYNPDRDERRRGARARPERTRRVARARPARGHRTVVVSRRPALRAGLLRARHPPRVARPGRGVRTRDRSGLVARVEPGPGFRPTVARRPERAGALPPDLAQPGPAPVDLLHPVRGGPLPRRRERHAGRSRAATASRVRPRSWLR